MANDQNTIDSSVQAQDHGQVFFEWSFPEFAVNQRSKSWYFWAGLIAGAFFLYSVIVANYLFAVFILITAGIILMFHRSDNQVDFKIAEDGILVNNKFFDYKILDHFFVIYDPPHVKTLYFEPKSYFNPRIPIPLEDQDPVAIRETLLEYLREELDREDEPVTDQIGKIFKL